MVTTPSPRDLFANERTFLAYVRTALAFIGFGFVLARFALFAREIAAMQHVVLVKTSLSATLAVAMTISGIAVTEFAAVRYVGENRALREEATALSCRATRFLLSGAVAICGALVAIGAPAIR